MNQEHNPKADGTTVPANHLAFTQRPDYKSLAQMSTKQLRHLANALRDAGQYNVTTLFCFKSCYLQTRRATDLLAYLLFTRDLGYLLSGARYARLDKILGSPCLLLFFRLGGRRSELRKALNLQAEQHQEPVSNQKSKKTLQAGHFKCSHWPGLSRSAQVEAWSKLEPARRSEFSHLILSASEICIVGNSPALKGKNLGECIDQHDVVVRFNNYRSEFTDVNDTGLKLDAWCMAPGVDKLAPDSQFAIVAGPDMLWRQQRFFQLDRYQGRVLGCPLLIWRQLVREFAAPPSAGLLLIAWIASIVNNRSVALRIVGFSYDGQGQYHHADPNHNPVSRHNWQAEALWLQDAIINKRIQELSQID